MGARTTVTITVLVAGLVLNSIGNGLLAAGMKHVAEGPGGWSLLLRVLAEPRVIGGVALQAGFFASYLFALSRADLSFVLPITAIDYLLTAFVAAFALGERPPPLRWAGIGLIALGVGLVIATDRGRGASAGVALYKGQSGWECRRRKILSPLPPSNAVFRRRGTYTQSPAPPTPGPS
jgi:drug/metabolite transporter (DMT)-like permease